MWNHVCCQRHTPSERLLHTWRCESSCWSWLPICQTVCCVCHSVGSDGCPIWVWRKTDTCLWGEYQHWKHPTYFKPWRAHWPGLFDAGLLRDGWDDVLLCVGFVFDWLLLVALFLLRSVSLWPHCLWTLYLWAPLTVGTLSFAIRAFLVCALAPLPPLLLGRGRHRVLLSHLLGNQLGVDPGFPVEEIQGTNMD